MNVQVAIAGRGSGAVVLASVRPNQGTETAPFGLMGDGTERQGWLPTTPHLPIGRNVYVLNRDELVRRGLRHLLESNGFTVVGESGSADEAAGRIAALRADLVILDDEFSDGTGAGVCHTVAEADRSIRCLLLTGQPEETVLIDSILAGAWGCLSLDDDNTEQLRLIRGGTGRAHRL